MANPHPKPSPGRPKGVQNRMTRMAVEEARKTGILPHEWLLNVMRGHGIKQKYWKVERDEAGNEISRMLKEETCYPDLDTRVEAAKAAAPYYAPKLATKIELTGADGKPLEVKDVGGLNDDEKIARIASLLDRAGTRAAQSAG